MKPDFFKDEDLGRLPFEARLLFAGLWGLADKAGRLEDRPIRIKAEIFPYDNVDIEKCLSLLSTTKTYGNGPFIHRYDADGRNYIQISSWNRHQKPHHTEKESEIPPIFIQKRKEPKENNGDGKGNGEGECSSGECEVTKRLNNGYQEKESLFNQFWKEYPRKQSKKQSLKAWLKLDFSNGLFDEIMLALKEQKKSDAWKKEGGAFIPHASTWLNGARWEDETKMVDMRIQEAMAYE